MYATPAGRKNNWFYILVSVTQLLLCLPFWNMSQEQLPLGMLRANRFLKRTLWLLDGDHVNMYYIITFPQRLGGGTAYITIR